MTLYIGSVLGGPEVAGTQVAELINRLARASHAYQEAHEMSSEGSLDIAYHVAGSLVRPQFEGLRTGKFSKREKTLMVQIAVPILFESDIHLAHFLVDALREAIDLAAPVFKSTKIYFSTEEYLTLVDAIAHNVRPGGGHRDKSN